MPLPWWVEWALEPLVVGIEYPLVLEGMMNTGLSLEEQANEEISGIYSQLNVEIQCVIL